MMKSPSIIIIMGPPGSGKGTQAELVSDEPNLYYFETSKVIEENVMQAKAADCATVDGKQYSLTKERENWKHGILNTPEVVAFWVENKIRELHKEGLGIVLAGSPRTLYEGKKIMPVLKELYGAKNIKIILLEISPEETLQRNSHRRICEFMRHPILSTKKEFLKLNYCPLDGSKLLRRKGLDDPESIKVRLKEYKERTMPLIAYYKKHGFAVKKINGEESVVDVHKDILKAIK